MSKETDESTKEEGLTAEEKRIIKFKEDVPISSPDKLEAEGFLKRIAKTFREQFPVLDLKEKEISKILDDKESPEKEVVKQKPVEVTVQTEKKQTKKKDNLTSEEMKNFYEEMELKKQLCIAAETDTNTPVEVAKEKIINTINTYFKDYPDLKECMEGLFPNRDIKQCTSRDLINCKESLIKSVKLRANVGMDNDEDNSAELVSSEPSEKEKTIKSAYTILKGQRTGDHMTNKITQGNSQAKDNKKIDIPSLMVASQAERGDVEIVPKLRHIFMPYLSQKGIVNVNG